MSRDGTIGSLGSDDQLFFLDEVKMMRTAALVATTLASLRRLELMGRGQCVKPETRDGFANLAGEAAQIRQRLAADREPILGMTETDPAARRLAGRADVLIAQLDELVALLTRLRADQPPDEGAAAEDHLHRP